VGRGAFDYDFPGKKSSGRGLLIIPTLGGGNLEGYYQVFLPERRGLGVAPTRIGRLVGKTWLVVGKGYVRKKSQEKTFRSCVKCKTGV